MILNPGPLDWESNVLTTRSLLHKNIKPIYLTLPQSLVLSININSFMTEAVII